MIGLQLIYISKKDPRSAANIHGFNYVADSKGTTHRQHKYHDLAQHCLP